MVSVETIKTIPENGMAIFSSIDIPVRILYPPRKIDRFIYRCDKKFILEPIEKLYIKPKHRFGVMRVFGEKIDIEICNEFLERKNISKKTARIQKKHKKGGQSQNRIQRLRTETIHNFLQLSSELAYDAYVEKGLPIIETLLICGPSVKKDEIKKYLKIDVKIYTYTIDKTTDINPLIQDMINNETGIKNKKHIEDLEHLIDNNSDLLTFGHSETVTQIDSLKIVYCTKKYAKIIGPKSIIVDGFIENYGSVIGVKYYDDCND